MTTLWTLAHSQEKRKKQKVVFQEMIIMVHMRIIMTMVLGGGANQNIMAQTSMPWDTEKAQAKGEAWIQQWLW